MGAGIGAATALSINGGNATPWWLTLCAIVFCAYAWWRL